MRKFNRVLLSRLISTVLSLCLLFGMTPVFASAEGGEFALSAKSAILIEAESGKIVYGKNETEKLPMASTTKIMTAVVALEMADLDAKVEVADEAIGVEGSSIYLTHGECLTISELLYALLLQSANDAATAIAYAVAGGVPEFADLMNDTAAKIGLCDTHFTNPLGLDDPEHYTTAADLAALTAYAFKNPTFREIVSSVSATIPSSDGEGVRVLVNHNRLLKTYDGAVGVKTGFTKKSGRCLVSAAERDGVCLIAVTLSASDDWNDHKKLLDYGFDSLERVTVAEPREFYIDLPCIGGNTPYVRCSNADSVTLTLPKGTRVTYRIEADRYFPAPVKAGDALGKVILYANGEEKCTLPLYAEHDVAPAEGKPSFIDRILRMFGR